MIKHFIFIDDCDMFRKVLRKHLKSSHVSDLARANVLGIESLGVVIDAIKIFEIDLVVLDIFLGSVDGFDVIEAISKQKRQPEIWVYTGLVEHHMHDARSSRINRYIHKDVGVEYLMDAVKEFVKE